MLNRYLIPTFLIGTAVVTLAAPSYGAEPLLPDQVAKIAKYTAVRIEPEVAEPGSGVIIGRYNRGSEKVYTILTAAHVVKRPDDDYSIVSPWPVVGKSREKIAINNKDIQFVPGLDLALVTFRSKVDYQTATLGDSDQVTEGSVVYVTGFPNPGAAIKQRVFQFTGALVSSRLDGDAVQGEAANEPLPGGYSIIYTNVTRQGMSGGPVFDVTGRLIGIHGKGDRELKEGTEAGQSVENIGEKTGFNLAIPLKSFLSKIPDKGSRIGAKYDGSPISLISSLTNNENLIKLAPLAPSVLRTIVEREEMNDSTPAPQPAPVKTPKRRF